MLNGESMYVMVGLGNPGLKYENTRHNVGFMTIDRIAEDYGVHVKTLKFKSLIGEVRIGNEKVILVKPQTYMNESGRAVVDIMNFYKLDPQNLIVIQDDIDIDFGSIRVKRKGSSGSHNGLKSIIYQINSDNFPRVKIAINKKPAYMDLADFVLSNFDKKEIPILREEILQAKEACLTIVKRGIDSSMNEYNSWRIDE